MSGIITGPYFDNYFKLTELQLGTTVAILEIGAFSKFLQCYGVYIQATSYDIMK